MPRPKNPKKNNGVQEPVVATSPVMSKVDGTAAEKAAASISAPEDRHAEVKTTVPKKTGKPEIVKAESRSNLIPINLEEEIRRLAYLLSERRGFEPGHETEDWLSAEREVRGRYHQQSA